MGFKKELYDGLDPQVDSWFCGGCVYRMEIIGTDKFYIGQTIKDINTYWGSGSEWIRYLDENNIPKDNKHIRKIILKDNGFYNWQDLRGAIFSKGDCKTEIIHESDVFLSLIVGTLYSTTVFLNVFLTLFLDILLHSTT